MPFDLSPKIAFYEVTQACDLVCSHCRACAQRQPHPAELSAEDARELVDQLMEFPEPPLLVLTGGDPLKRNDIFDLIDYAVGRGLEVSITPSATPLVTSSAIQRFYDVGISRMAISIDGADAATHDETRGVAGSFLRSLEILEEARRVGLETQINTVLTPKNFGQIERMAERFEQLKIALWSVFFLVPVGRGDQLPRLSADQCEDAFARLWRQSQERPFLIKTTEAPHYRRFVIQQGRQSMQQKAALPALRPRPYLGLNDGKGIMFISHTGTVQPSGFLTTTCGVFPFQHLVRIYQDSPIFKKLRDSSNLEGKCHYCEYRNICGGSRSRAFGLTGNMFAPEPDCIYQPTAKQL